MAFTEALRLLITADSAGAVRSIQQVGRTTERELSRSEKSLDRWGSRLSSVGAGLISFGAIAAYGLNQAAQSAVDLGEAVNATNVVFGSASATVDKYAETSAKSMGLSERAFRQALVPIGAMLKNVGLSEEDAADQSVKLAQRAADMASVFNTDVTTALEAIQAGLRGEADPLERFGVGLNEAAVNAKAVELGLAATTGEVDASAKAQARLALIFEQTNSFAGDFANTSDSLANRQRILSAEFENLKAAIGAGVIPVMETLFDVASKGVAGFSSLNDATGGMLGQIATIATVASIGIGGLSLLAGQVIKTRDSISGGIDAISRFVGGRGLGNLAISLAKGGAVIGGLLLLEEVLDSVFGGQSETSRANLGRLEADLVKFGNSSKVTGELLKVVGEDFKDLKDAFKDVDVSGVEGARASVDRFAASIPGLGHVIGTGFASNIDNAKQKVDDFDKALADIASQDPERAFDILSQAADALGVDVDELLPLLDDYDTAVGEVESNAALAGDEVDNFGRSMDASADSTEEAKTRLEEYVDELKGLTDPVFAATNALTGVRDAQIAVRDAENEVVTATEALNDALESGDQAAIAEATRGLEDANRNLSDAQWATVESAAEADSALAGLKDAVDNGDVSVDQFKRTLGLWVAQGFLTQGQADAAAASVGALADQAATADQQRVEIPVSTTGTEQTATDLLILRERINNIPREINIVTRMTTILAGSTNVPLRDSGGPVTAGNAYMIGVNRKPELFIPDQDGMVLPFTSSTAPAGSFGGGGGAMVEETIIVKIGEDEIARAVRRSDKRSRR